MPAKLTEKQIEALKDMHRTQSSMGAHPVTIASLLKRGLVCADKSNYGYTDYRLTDAGREALAWLTNDWLKEDPTAPGHNPHIPEPPIDPDDTKPLPVITCTTCGKGFEWCFRRDCPHAPPQAREWYKRMYRYERHDAKGEYAMLDIDDVPEDIAIAAHQSLQAAPQPTCTPFMLRVLEKRMRDLLDALQRVPLFDDRTFDNLVLDFKEAKYAYINWQERFDLRTAAGARR